MLKTTGSPNKPASSKNNGSRSASSMNNNNKPAFGRNDGNSKVDRFGGNNVDHVRKSRKLKKLSKSQKSAKLGKKLSKSGILLNFNAKDNRPSFQTPKAKANFNRL